MSIRQYACPEPSQAARIPEFETVSSQYVFVRSRQLEGTYPGDGAMGTWPITPLRVLGGWGTVAEKDWPRSSEWPPREPPNLDSRAKPQRIHHYQRIRSVAECCIALGHMRPITVTLEIFEQWFSAKKGVIALPEDGEPAIGNHCVLIVGLDRIHNGFAFVNSWANDWGYQGWGILPFEYYQEHVIAAWTMAIPRSFGAELRGAAGEPTEWGILDCLGNSVHGGDILHGREVYDHVADERKGWAFFVHRDGFLDIEELFVKPPFRRQGIGKQLAMMAMDLSAKCRRPLRMWIPFADWSEANLPIIKNLAARMQLQLFHSDVRWAAAQAIVPETVPANPWKQDSPNAF